MVTILMPAYRNVTMKYLSNSPLQAKFIENLFIIYAIHWRNSSEDLAPSWKVKPYLLKQKVSHSPKNL